MRVIGLPKRHAVATLGTAILLCASMTGVSPAWADNDKGGGKGKSSEKKGGGNSNNAQQGGSQPSSAQSRDSNVRVEVYFDDRRRTVAQQYYGEQFKAGKCPPGLAKKQNGCMPPGQAKQWVKGRPLPREVIYYEVPQSLVIQLGVPPAGHRYVRVAADILLIAVGTGMVLDAIEDLGRM